MLSAYQGLIYISVSNLDYESLLTRMSACGQYLTIIVSSLLSTVCLGFKSRPNKELV